MPETQIKPDTISVSATQKGEISATGVRLFVAVEGASLFTGQEAFKKAREVAQLVSDLTAAGISPDQVNLQSVSLKSAAKGVRSSAATYLLRVECRDLDRMGAILGAVADQKNASLKRIEWTYPSERGWRDTALDSVIQFANERAARIAKGLGVQVIGVWSFQDRYTDTEDSGRYGSFISEERAGSAGVQQIDLGTELRHSKEVQLTVNIEYRISGL